MTMPSGRLHAGDGIKAFVLLVAFGFVALPATLKLWFLLSGRTTPVAEVFNVAFHDPGRLNIREIFLLLAFIFFPYVIYSLIITLNKYKAINTCLSALNKCGTGSINNRKAMHAGLFALPGTASLLVLHITYNLHHWGIAEIPHQIRHHIFAINDRFPIFAYSLGLYITAFLMSALFSKMKGNVYGYLAASVLGVSIYVSAVMAMYILLIPYLVLTGRDLFEVASAIPYATVFAFTGVCFQDCIYGYAWPSIPIGALWGPVVFRYMNQSTSHGA